MRVVVLSLARVLDQILVERLEMLVQLEFLKVDFAAWEIVLKVVA